MIGAMIYKDFAVIKRSAAFYIGLMALYFGMAVAGVFEGTGMLNSFAGMFSLAIPMACFSVDELARWEKFAITLPLGRKGVVKARYVMILLLTIGTMLLIVLLNLALFVFLPSRISSLPAGILGAVGVSAGCLLVHAIMTPVCFKFGVQKARVVVAVTAGVATMAAVSLSAITVFPMLGIAAVKGWSPLLGQVSAMVLAGVVGALLLLLASYHVALRLYEKKEF